MKKFFKVLTALITIIFIAVIISILVVLFVLYGPSKSFDELEQGETLYVRDVDVYKISENVALEDNLRIDNPNDRIIHLEKVDDSVVLQGNFLKFYYNSNYLAVYNIEEDGIIVYLYDVQATLLGEFTVHDFETRYNIEEFTEKIISDRAVK